MEASAVKPFGSEQDLPPELKAILVQVREAKETGERHQKPHRDRWDRYYGLYRNYRKLVSARRGSSENDRDQVLNDARREWGAELFIPYCYATVETVVPRILSNDPKMLVRPRSPEARASARAVEELINTQQSEIGYDLKLQSVVRSGLKYGLGVQKTFWDEQKRKVLRTAPAKRGRRLLPGGKRSSGFTAVENEITLYAGPNVEWVDIWDFFWDPAANSIETASWVIHRTWRDLGYIKKKVEAGTWFPLDMKAVEGMGSESARGELWKERMDAAGVSGYETKQGKMHEVWEYHDREHVYTVLDNALVVQADRTPFYHRELPFQIFRPTPVEGEFVGIGEIEPIAHLQYELNTLRQQRRDNATLVLQKAFLYKEGRANPADFVIGPGMGIPVLGDPKNDIVPLQFPEIPASGYQEEAALKSDIELASGVSDPVAGGSGDGGGGAETATGVQLIQQAANVRIRHKTKNVEREICRPAARQWLELDRQHILKPAPIRVEDESTPDGFRFSEVGPDQLQDDIDFPIPEGGSTEPDNPAERQQRALQVHQIFGQNRQIDQRKLSQHILEELDVRNPEAFLIAQEPKVDPRIIAATLQQAGVDPAQIEEAVEMALMAEQDADAAEQEAA